MIWYAVNKSLSWLLAYQALCNVLCSQNSISTLHNTCVYCVHTSVSVCSVHTLFVCDNFSWHKSRKYFQIVNSSNRFHFKIKNNINNYVGLFNFHVEDPKFMLGKSVDWCLQKTYLVLLENHVLLIIILINDKKLSETFKINFCRKNGTPNTYMIYNIIIIWV